jgi:hypothetical protein
MNHIIVRSDFADRHDFRLMAMDDAWLTHFCEHPCGSSAVARNPASSSSSHKRERAADHDADTSVVLIMKGEDQLCLHDGTSTRTVRRVEYSNVLMLARRRLTAAGKRAMEERSTAEAASASKDQPSNPSAASLPLVRVREYNDDVVVASLSRMFDTHAANPQLRILAVLADSYLTIDELEAVDDGTEHHTCAGDHGCSSTYANSGDGGTPSGYTFAELTRRFHSSPAELAQLLEYHGAVVHRGHVRLLHPSLVYEALDAVLTYFDAVEPAALSWAAVQQHLCPSVYPVVVLRSLQAMYGSLTPSSPTTTAADNADGTAEREDVSDDGVSVGGMASVLNIPRVLTGLAAGVFDTHAGVTRRTLSTGENVRGLPLDVFLEQWWNSIPSSLLGSAGVPSRYNPEATELLLEKLRGYAVVEPRIGSGGNSSSAVQQGMLWWMPKDLLTSNFAARLRVLFELRPQRWNQAELKAYMDVLLAPDQSFQHVILRHAREYRIPGQVVQYAPLA